MNPTDRRAKRKLQEERDMRLCNKRLTTLASAVLAVVLGLTPCVTMSVAAQATTGGIRGVVADVNGAVVSNASVVAINVATGVEYKGTGTGDGIYSIPRLPLGRYDVTVQVQGFKKGEYKQVEVVSGRDTVVDVKLEPGEVSETVTVTASGEVAIEKDTAQISARFGGRAITDLPINVGGGGLDRIALAMPGITPGIAANVNANGTQLSANGNRTRANNFSIDGVDNNDLSIGGPNYFVRNKDLVEEFQVTTSNFSAEYGRNAGAIINIVSKQGTNALHGAVTWYHQDNKIFNSLTNLERRSGQKNPTPNLNNVFTYGVGGPVYIPKLFDGREKLFFFTAGEIRRNPGLSDLRTTNLSPTQAGIAALKAAFPSNAAIQYFANNSAFALPFGNPEVRADVAQTTVTIGSVTVPLAAVRRVFPVPDNRKEFNQRVDFNMTDKNRIWGRWFWQDSPGKNFLGNVAGFTGDQPAKSQQAGGGWTYNVSNRAVNEFRFNYSRLFVLFGGGCEASSPGCIPDPGDIDKALTNFALQFTAANGSAVQGVGPATNLPQGRTVESFQFTDNYNLTVGRHQMKFGADIRRLLNNAPFLPNVNGQFVFNTTAQFASNAAGSVNVALGPAALSYTEWDKFFYLQDDWRIKPNLTLNLGIRYEHTGQPINLLNDITAKREADPAEAFWLQSAPIDQRSVPRVPTDKNNWAPRLSFVYTPEFSGGILHKLFGDDDTVIRGGYGISYDAAFYNLLLNISTSSPLVFATTTNIPVPDAVPTGDKVRGAAVAAGAIRFNTFNPSFFNRTIVKEDFRSPYIQQWSFGVQRQLSRGYVAESRYVGNHQVGLYQSINNNPFVGNLINGFSRPFRTSATATPGTMTFRGFPELFPGVTPLACVNNPATPDNEAACNGRIFPYGVARERINGAQASYHGLQNRFEGRVRGWLYYGANYTWSHTIDNSSEVFSFAGGNSVAVAQNPLDITRGEKGHSGFDTRHVFSAYWVWDIPVMKSQNGVIGKIVGGWQLNGILRLQNGVRFTPTQQATARNPYEDTALMAAFFGSQSQMRPFSGNPNAALGSVAITDVDACIFYGRCGAAGGVPILQRSSTGFYSFNDLNRGVFTPTTPDDVRFIVNGPGAAQVFGTPFGNVGRNFFTGDRVETIDFSVFKTTRVKEGVAIQYRLNMFNALNHPVFGIPNQINLDQAGTTFYNFKENSGGRRTIEMALRITF
jgi:outer membrane receptor protein involved in Fe transport